jgi:hypothetical protein
VSFVSFVSLFQPTLDLCGLWILAPAKLMEETHQTHQTHEDPLRQERSTVPMMFGETGAGGPAGGAGGAARTGRSVIGVQRGRERAG